MTILISSHAFAPSIGGLETVTRLLAHEFVGLGHKTTVITQTPGSTDATLPFDVVRQPKPSEVRALARKSDVFWQNNLSLRTLWPALSLPLPVVITHQGSYCPQPRGLDLPLRLKRAVVRRYPSVAISHAVAGCFDNASVVIPNPYDAAIFSNKSTPTERSGFIFVGRLVAEKGVDLLLEAFARVTGHNSAPQLTIVGDGPELPKLKALAAQYGLTNTVEFVGAASPQDVAAKLNAHRVLVVPSLYDEPFGIVALEGIACGCAVIGSSGGGLPEAIGPCGVTFPNGNLDSLVRALERFGQDVFAAAPFASQAAAHLARFHPRTIATAYLGLFESLK